jgi:cytochrome P450
MAGVIGGRFEAAREILAGIVINAYKHVPNRDWGDVWPNPIFFSRKRVPDVFQSTLESLHQEYGDHVRLKAKGYNVLVVSSPPAVREIFTRMPVEKTVDRGITKKIGSYFDPNVLTSPDSVAKEFHDFYMRRISKRAVALQDQTREIAARYVAGMEPGATDLQPLFRKIAFHASLKMLFDVDDVDLDDNAADIGAMEAFYQAVESIQDSYLSGDRALDHVIARLRAQVEERMKAWKIEPEVDDPHLNINQAIILQNAGFETTAATLSWMAHHAALDPSFQNGEPKFVLGMMNETLRLHPPVHVVSRTAVESFSVREYEYEAGDVILCNIAAAHVHPGFWADPARFDPERDFATGAFLPFALGPRACAGQMQGRVVAREVFAALFERFRLAPWPGRAVGRVESFTVKPSACPVILERRQATSSRRLVKIGERDV